MPPRLPAEDLDLVLSQTASFWPRFSGARMLVTGGSGFIGRWLVQSVQHANDRLGSRIELVVLSRDAQRAHERDPATFARSDTQLASADLTSGLPPLGRLDLCVHAATDVGDALRPADPLKVFDSIVAGTRNTLESASAAGTQRFLLASSGAVYGTQPLKLPAMPETYSGAPDPMDPAAAYGNGKRAAEWLAAAYGAGRGPSGFAACSARIFALLGPGLPLDGGFAAGNFIRDALAGRSIRVLGDGRPLRTYLYMADLCVWLLRILERGSPGAAYNVGGQEAVSIAQLARAIGEAAARPGTVEIGRQPASDAPPPRYVPDTGKARTALGLSEYTPLASAIAKTIAWSR